MRIAIVKLSALGDIVHAMVVLQFIKNKHKDILIDWIVEESYSEVLKFNPDINKIHFVKIKQAKQKSIIAIIKELIRVRKLNSYDLVIDMQGLIKSAIISRLIKSSKTIGFDSYSIRERAASIFYNKSFSCAYETNIIERNLGLVSYALGLKLDINQIDNKVSYLYSKKSQLNFEIKESKKNIILIPGASHELKRYPVSKFGELTNLIDANFFIIWGSQQEKILADKIQAISPKVTVCEKLELDSLIFLISKVDLVIGSDTGPTHFAWAMNIPSITLFGATPGSRNTWTTQINRIIESDSKVDPKNLNKNDDSIKEIDTKKILYVAQELLNKN